MEVKIPAKCQLSHLDGVGFLSGCFSALPSVILTLFYHDLCNLSYDKLCINIWIYVIFSLQLAA